ncbi:MAG: hypothetical protein L0H94_03030 [Nitrospira sp.]|nr:hypothetical protein [Nitrospira sp.]
MVRANAASPGRYRIADKVGQDKMSVVNVRFEPEDTTWSTDTNTTLKLKLRNKFDSSVNVNNATDITDLIPDKYSLVVRSAGAFSAISGQTAVGDSVTFSGKGTFSSSLVNVPMLSPAGSAHNTVTLNFTVGGPVNDPGPLSYDGNTNATMGQQVTYPRFICIDPLNTTKCRADITLTMLVELYGPDSFTVVNGNDMFCANCALTPEESADLAKKKARLAKLVKLAKAVDAFITRPTPRLTAWIVQAEAFLNITNNPDTECFGEQLNEADVQIASGNDQIAFAEINAKPAVPAPPHYYAVISSPGLTWLEAKNAAEALGEGWHLATINSEAENEIITSMLPDPSVFEGTEDFWIGGEQENCEDEPGCNWRWFDAAAGDFFWNNGPTGKFANWGSTSTGPANEPNNLGGSENHLTVDSRYGWGWNDLNNNGATGTTKGYIAEGPNPLPPPID